MNNILKAMALTIALSLAGSGIATAASFSDFSSGVKSLTDSAKDLKKLATGEEEPAPEATPPAAKQPAPSKKQPSKKAPQEEERYRGG